MLQPKDLVEVQKTGDPNNGREGAIVAPTPVPVSAFHPQPRRYDVAFEGGLEHAEYADHELRRVTLPKRSV